MSEIDEKLKELLTKMESANQDYQNRYITPVIKNNEIQPHDFFELALAQDSLNLLEVQYELLLSQKFPERYTTGTIDHLRKEEAELKEKIELWKNRELPKA